MDTEKELILLNVIQCICGNLWLNSDRSIGIDEFAKLLIDKAFGTMSMSGSANKFSSEDMKAAYEFLSCLFPEGE